MDVTVKYGRRVALAAAGSFLAGAAGVGATARWALAVEPPRRSAGSRFRLSCAAYSMRKYLDLKSPKMTLEDFISRCAEWGSDGVELTEYYFPKPIEPSYIGKLKRLAFLNGL